MAHEPIEYTVRKSARSRHVRLSIDADGHVVVTLPRRASEQVAHDMVRSHSAWILKKLAHIKRTVGDRVQLGGMGGFREHKDAAMRVALERLSRLNSIYGFSFHHVCIRDNRSRWGSCSKKGNINFHYKIVFLPDALIDYLVVHELCHCKEFNHSSRFWKLVAQTIPDYKKRRKDLRRFALK